MGIHKDSLFTTKTQIPNNKTLLVLPHLKIASALKKRYTKSPERSQKTQLIVLATKVELLQTQNKN